MVAALSPGDQNPHRYGTSLFPLLAVASWTWVLRNTVVEDLRVKAALHTFQIAHSHFSARHRVTFGHTQLALFKIGHVTLKKKKRGGDK